MSFRKIYPTRIGEPLFTGKQLRALLIPLIIEQVLSATVGIADTVMVSQVSEQAMSGVALVDSINMLIINIFAAFATGGTIVTSQYLGRKDEANARESARQAVMFIASLALTIAAISMCFRGSILRALYQDVEPLIMDSALIYYLITAMSYPFIAIFGICAAIHRTMGNSKFPLTASIAMNITNVAGNAVLIFGFGMGAAGVAIPTLVSRILSATILFISLQSPKRTVHIRGLFPFRINLSMIKKILAIGIPAGLENGIFQIGKVLVQTFISGMGTASIAAAAVANSIASAIMMPGIAVGMCLVTVAGRCVGAGKYDQVRRYGVGFTGLAVIVMLIINTIVFLLIDPIISSFGISDGTATLAKQIIHILLVGTVTIWPLAFSLPNVLRASNDVRFTMVVSIGAMWLFRVGLGYLLSVTMGIGIIGIWYGMVFDWLFRAVIYIYRFCGSKWDHHAILDDPR